MEIILGGGCFWCTEATLKLIDGIQVTPGYSGGEESTANYYQVSTGNTDHAEVVKVEYDNGEKLKDILKVFFKSHNPTTLNRQGADIGRQYRSVIFYETDTQKEVIDKHIENIQQDYDNKIVTEVEKLDKFYEAEPEHHDYFDKNPDKAYCQIVIKPKIEKIKNEV